MPVWLAMFDWLLLAQEGVLLAQEGVLLAQEGLIPVQWFLPLAIIFLLWMVVLRPQQREKKAHQVRLASLKKNDRVVTIGGIYGTVSNVRREADDVELKTDEPSNSVIHVTLGAISRIIEKEKDKEQA